MLKDLANPSFDLNNTSLDRRALNGTPTYLQWGQLITKRIKPLKTENKISNTYVKEYVYGFNSERYTL